MITVILWLLLSAVFFGVGEYYSKIWAMNPSVKLALIMIFMYFIGTLTWMPAMYHGKILSVVGSIWNVLSLLTTCFIGIVIFKEALTTLKIIGILFAVASIILLSI